MPNDQDKMVTHFRHWIYRKAGGGLKWGAAAAAQPLPSRLSYKEAFDVYHAHTKHCKLCSAALRNITLLRNISLTLAAVLIGLLKGPLRKLLSSTLMCGVAYVMEYQRQSFYAYDFSHQDND